MIKGEQVDGMGGGGASTWLDCDDVVETSHTCGPRLLFQSCTEDTCGQRRLLIPVTEYFLFGDKKVKAFFLDFIE